MKSLTKLSAAQLRTHNRQVTAADIKPGLTDRQVRAEAAKLLAAGKADGAAVTGVESTLRQSRRKNSHYERLHVHTGAEALDFYAEASSDAGARKGEAKLTHGVEGSSGTTRAEVVSAGAKLAEHGAERISFGDGRGSDNTVDSENVSPSAGEALPFAGGKFRQTERVAAAKVSAARERDSVYAKLAWQDFENDHPADAGSIEKIRAHAVGHLSEDAVRLEDRDPNKAFALWVASWAKKLRQKARQARIAMVMEEWANWRRYLKQWRREHPEVKLPDDSRQTVARVSDAVREAILGNLYGVGAGTRAAAQSAALSVLADTRDAAWEREGMPVYGSGLFRLKPLEEIMREVSDATRWENPLRARRMENGARARWFEQYNQHRPRSLIEYVQGLGTRRNLINS